MTTLAPTTHGAFARPAPAGDASLRWRAIRTVNPLRAEPGSFGPAVAISNGRLWIGPARDTDVGDGPPRVTSIGIRAGFGLPSFDPVGIRHPAESRNAGFGLSLSAAQGICVVGSPHAGCRERGCDSGQVHLFSLDRDGSWRVDEVTCPDAEPASEFGAAVATDGLTIAVGSPRCDAPQRDSGAVNLYHIQPDADREVRHLLRIASPSPQIGSRFGASVAVDGDWVAIGEPNSGDTFPRAGLVHFLHRTAQGWAFHSSLRAPAGAVGWFGTSVALAGRNLLVGAPIARSASGNISAGAAVLCVLEADQWVVRKVISAPNPGAGDGFGMAVALRSGWMAVGAPGTDSHGEDAGAAWLFELRGNRCERIVSHAPRAGDGFGAGLAFGTATGRAVGGPTDFLAVSARSDPERPMEPGAVDLFGYFNSPAVKLTDHHPQSIGPQSMSASCMAIAAESSVTIAGDQPAASACSSARAP